MIVTINVTAVQSVSHPLIGCKMALIGVVIFFLLYGFTSNECADAAELGKEVGYSNCIRATGPNNNGNWKFQNSCFTGLTVKWSDDKDCRNWKCTAEMGGQGKEGDVQSIGTLVGAVLIAACRYPISPQVRADGRYECVPIGGSSADTMASQASAYSPNPTKKDQRTSSSSQFCDEISSRRDLALSTEKEKSLLAQTSRSCAAFSEWGQAATNFLNLSRQLVARCDSPASRVQEYAHIDAKAKLVEDRIAEVDSKCQVTNPAKETIDPCAEVENFVNSASCDLAADGSDSGAAIAANCTSERLTTLSSRLRECPLVLEKLRKDCRYYVSKTGSYARQVPAGMCDR